MMVHNSRARLATVERLIRGFAPSRAYRISDLKRSGDIVVRFRSTDEQDAVSYAEAFVEAMLEAGARCMWVAHETNVSVVLETVPV